MKLFRFGVFGGIAIALVTSLLTGCSSKFYYRFVLPISQTDHPASEFGADAIKRANLSAQGPIRCTKRKLCAVKPLERGKRTYIVLQMDGGGIMGITPARLLRQVEQAVLSREEYRDRNLRDAISVCSGTSTGAIMAGAIAAGVSAYDISEFYENEGYQLFTDTGLNPCSPILQFKFNRSAFQQSMIDVLRCKSPESSNVRLRDLGDGPLLMLAAYDLVGRRTLFLRSRTENNCCVPNGKNVKLIDAIGASALSAPVYFGKIAAPNFEWEKTDAEGNVQRMRGAVFADGGQGTQNSTLAVSAIEALRLIQEDPGCQVVLISFGAGNDFSDRGFEKVIGYWGFQQLADFIFRNQARSEAIMLQKAAVAKIEAIVGDNLKVFRFNWNHTDDKNATAFSINSEQRDWLKAKAREIACRPEFRQLVHDLSDPNVLIQPYRTACQACVCECLQEN